MRLRLWLLLTPAAWAAPTALCAQAADGAGRYQIVTDHSQIRFKAKKWAVFDVEGIFRAFTGDIRYDTVDVEHSSVAWTAQTASISTGEDRRDESLRDDTFLDVVKFPTMRFVSTSVTSGANGTLTITGDFTLKGVTRRISFPAKVLGVADIPGEGVMAAFEADLVLDREAYGVLGGPLSRKMVGRDVAVHLAIGAKKVR